MRLLEYFIRAVQRNPGLFHGMVLMGPFIKTTEEIPMSQIMAARLGSYVYPTFQMKSFPLVNIIFAYMKFALKHNGRK